jgi:hypothetical protein
MCAKARTPATYRSGILAVSVCVFLLSHTDSYGSECGTAPAGAAIRAADVVIRGTVTKVEDPASTEQESAPSEKIALQSFSSYKIVTVRVTKVWKGPQRKLFRLFVLGNPRLFSVGTEYVIYALDEVVQDWSVVHRFATQGRVYGIGTDCTLRVRTDVLSESRILDAIARTQVR